MVILQPITFRYCHGLFPVFSVALEGFASHGNIANMPCSIAILGVLSTGMAVVVIGRDSMVSVVEEFTGGQAAEEEIIYTALH